MPLRAIILIMALYGFDAIIPLVDKAAEKSVKAQKGVSKRGSRGLPKGVKGKGRGLPARATARAEVFLHFWPGLS